MEITSIIKKGQRIIPEPLSPIQKLVAKLFNIPVKQGYHHSLTVRVNAIANMVMERDVVELDNGTRFMVIEALDEPNPILKMEMVEGIACDIQHLRYLGCQFVVVASMYPMQ